MLKTIRSSLKFSPAVATKLVWSSFAVSLSAVVLTSALMKKSEFVESPVSYPKSDMAAEIFETPLDKELNIAKHYPHNDPLHDEKEPPFPFATEIKDISDRMAVAPGLIYAIAKAESGFRTHAESKAGALGLMQVVAHTAGKDAWQKVLNEKGHPSKQSLKDPYTNLLLGSAYVKLLNDHYFKHIDDNDVKLGLILAAYNWGPTNVKRMLSKGFPRDMKELHWTLYVRAPKETYRYVKKVLKFKAQFETDFKEHA